MLTVFNIGNPSCSSVPLGDVVRPGQEPLWFDLLEPSLEEVERLESLLKIELPTKVDMEEIESSSRLYIENEGLFLTGSMLAHGDDDLTEMVPVSFILKDRFLITIRYADSIPFRSFIRSMSRRSQGFQTPLEALAMLLDSVFDRLADILERTGAELDAVNREVFVERRGGAKRESGREIDNHLKQLMVRLGRHGDVNSKARESLVSFSRLIVYLLSSDPVLQDPSTQITLKALGRDLSSLSDHANFLSSKVNFLLDAILGLINIEQNQIIKIFSIAAVIFLPPTLVASVYGMNFAHMPETSYRWGYPMSLGLMVISALIPFLYFRKKGWI